VTGQTTWYNFDHFCLRSKLPYSNGPSLMGSEKITESSPISRQSRMVVWPLTRSTLYRFSRIDVTQIAKTWKDPTVWIKYTLWHTSVQYSGPVDKCWLVSVSWRVSFQNWCLLDNWCALFTLQFRLQSFFHRRSFIFFVSHQTLSTYTLQK
jgi:hypothetical protein